MKAVVINKHIVADPGICHGKLTFKGTRIMVWQVLEMLEEGRTAEDVIEAFPLLTKNHIKSSLSYAADIAKGRNYVLVSV